MTFTPHYYCSIDMWDLAMLALVLALSIIGFVICDM